MVFYGRLAVWLSVSLLLASSQRWWRIELHSAICCRQQQCYHLHAYICIFRCKHIYFHLRPMTAGILRFSIISNFYVSIFNGFSAYPFYAFIAFESASTFTVSPLRVVLLHVLRMHNILTCCMLHVASMLTYPMWCALL